MKKLLLCLTFLSTIGQMASQTTFNKAYQDINEQPNPFLVNISGDLYFTTSNYDVGHFALTNLYKHDAAGNLIFRTTVPGSNAGKGFKSLDDKLVIVSRRNTCDIAYPTQVNYLTKLNTTNGSSMFTSTFVTKTSDNTTAALQHSDSSYFIFTDSLLFKFSKTGQFISKINFGFEGISSAMLLSNNNILISANQSNTKLLAEISPSGVVITSSPLPVLLSKLSYYGGQKIMGLGNDGKLYKFSTSRNLINLSAFPGGFIADFVIHTDSIYSVLSSASAGVNYAVSDTSFNTLFQSTTTTHSFGQNALCLSSNKVAILGAGLASMNAWGGSSYHYFASLSVINKFSGNNFTSDLALLSVIPDSSYISCAFSIFPYPGEFHCSSYLRPKIKIKNKGISAITEFKLNCFDSPAIACGAYFYQEKFSGLSLQPGDSLMLTATKFAMKGYAYSGPASTFTAQYCFYITLPNGETDKVFEDNEFCNPASFIVTSLNDYSKSDLSIKVSPNPFENNLSVESESTIKTIEIMNALGMTVCKKDVNDTKTIFSDSRLSNGVYFLKIETEKGTVTKKIIKQ